MSNADAAWLHMDRPTNLMVVNALLWLEEPVDVDRVKKILRSRLVEPFPRIRQEGGYAQRVFDRPASRCRPGSVARRRYGLVCDAE